MRLKTEIWHRIRYCMMVCNISNVFLCWQIALCTLLLNLSVAVLRVNDVSCQHELVATLSLILPWLPEPEALLRGLVALGTLLRHSTSLHEELSPEAVERLRSVATISASDPTQTKVASCSRQLLGLLKLQVSWILKYHSKIDP